MDESVILSVKNEKSDEIYDFLVKNDDFYGFLHEKTVKKQSKNTKNT